VSKAAVLGLFLEAAGVDDADVGWTMMSGVRGSAPSAGRPGRLNIVSSERP
jgi:hypothetical protein